MAPTSPHHLQRSNQTTLYTATLFIYLAVAPIPLSDVEVCAFRGLALPLLCRRKRSAAEPVNNASIGVSRSVRPALDSEAY